MSMQYFWLEGSDLPAGIGFGLFTARHFAALTVCCLVMALLCLWFVRLSQHSQALTLRVLAVLLLAGNLVRDLFLLSIHRMSIAYLPLHLCSFSIFVYLLHAFLPETDRIISTNADLSAPRSHIVRRVGQSRLREALGEIGVVLLMPGSFCALLFPDWSAYPLWNFLSIHSFVWHTVLAAYPMLLLVSGRVHPTIRHIWYPFVYLLIEVPPTWLFDVKTGCNYLFVSRPVPGTPLEWLQERMGAAWRAGYALLVAAVILIIYLVIELCHALYRRLSSRSLL